MDKTAIRKVELLSDGLKGLKVEYAVPTKIKGREFVNERTEKLKHPTHLAIDNHFKELRHGLLDIFDIIKDKDKSEIDYEMSITKVTEVSYNGSRFKIKGVKEVVGELPVALCTPWITEETGYENYEGVVAIIEHLFEEVVFYMDGSVNVTSDEVAVKIILNDKKRGVTKEDLEMMNDEERKSLLSEVLEEVYGATVFFPEDVMLGESEDLSDFVKNAEVIPVSLDLPDEGLSLGDKEEVVLPA